MKTEENELDYEYTDAIKCPYCDCVFSDSWEVAPEHDGDEKRIKIPKY